MPLAKHDKFVFMDKQARFINRTNSEQTRHLVVIVFKQFCDSRHVVNFFFGFAHLKCGAIFTDEVVVLLVDGA